MPTKIGSYKSSYLLKMIVGFGVCIMSLVGLLGGYLFSHSQRLITEEISKDSLYRLEYMRDFLENVWLKRYEDVYRDKLVATVFSNYEGLSYYLQPQSVFNGYRVMETQKELERLKMSQPGLDNLTLLFKQDDMVIDAQYYYSSSDNSKDATFMKALSDSPIYRWFLRTNGQDRQVMTYVQPLPYQAEGEQVQGYMYVDVSVAEIAEVLGGMLSSARESLYLLDGGSMIALGGQHGHQPEAQREVHPSKRLVAEVEIVEEQGQTTVWAYSPESLSRHGFALTIARPLDAMLVQSRQFQRDLVLASLAVLVIGLIAAGVISRQFYRPLGRLARRIREMPGSARLTAEGNEYRVLDHAFSQLNHQLRDLQERQGGSRLLKLLHGDPREWEEAVVVTATTLFQVAYVQGKREGALWLDTLPDNEHVAAEIVQLSEREWVILFRYEREEQQASTLSITEQLSTWHKLCHHTDTALSLGIGDAINSPEEVSMSFEQAKEAARYAFLYGKGAVIPFSKIKDRRNALAPLSMEPYEHAILTSDQAALRAYLSKLEVDLMESNCTIDAIEWAYLQLAVTLRKLALPYNRALQAHRTDNIAADDTDKGMLDRPDTLREGLQQLEIGCTQLIEVLGASATHSHADTIKHMQDYMVEHLAEDLSLERVAEVANFSPSYVSKLFVEVLNVSFIEYLTRIRMKRAADLLRSTQVPVVQIAREVGYSNSQYFSTKFKARFALTPLQYRKADEVKLAHGRGEQPTEA